MQPVWEKFLHLYQAVEMDHLEHGRVGGGHDIYHAIMVAQYATLIAEDERTGELAAIAGLLHNTDRLYDVPVKTIVDKRLRRLEGLDGFRLSKEEWATIVEAVEKHNELNSDDDSLVLITLKDADRLANIGPAVVIRAGQFYHDLPAFDPRHVVTPDPRSSYRQPLTVMRDIYSSLEWKSWMRLPKAKKLAEKYFAFLENFFELCATQVAETGLYTPSLPVDSLEDFYATKLPRHEPHTVDEGL